MQVAQYSLHPATPSRHHHCYLNPADQNFRTIARTCRPFWTCILTCDYRASGRTRCRCPGAGREVSVSKGGCPSWTQPVLAGSSRPRAGPGSANQSSRRCHSDQVSQWGTNVTQQQGMRDTAWAPAQHTHALRLQTDLMTSGESATGINLCAGMCKHRKDLPSPFPFILLLMKSLTVTLICDSIKSFLMLKILHFLEHQPTAKGLVCSHCYPFTVFPSPIKSKCVPRSSLLPICFQSEELITLYKLHLQNCGDNFFSVWFWGFIWSMRIYSLWYRHRAVNPQAPKASHCWHFSYWYTI